MTETSIQNEAAIENGEALPAASACGAVLKAAREQKNLTIEDISSRLRLSVHQIKALEDDDFSILPSAATMTRGFIRNYARLLEIDAEPLLQVYQAHAASQTKHSLTIKSENILISSTQKPVWKKYIISSLLILLLIGAWVIYMDYFHLAKGHTKTVPIAQTDAESGTLPPAITTEPMPEPALPVAERNAAEEVIAPPAEATPAEKLVTDNSSPTPTPATTAVAPVSAAPVAKPIEPVKPATPAPLTTVPATNSASAVVNNQNQTPPSSTAKPALKIRFTFSEPTWVSVLDADNKEVFNKTGQPGSKEQIEVTPPAKLVIGNANGAQLEVNNKSIDLAPYNKLNVVRLTLE